MRIVKCGLCGRDAPRSRHHATPRQIARRRRRRDVEPQSLEDLCRDCHGKVHSLFTNQALAESYPTLEKLRAAPGMAEWVGFIRKRPVTQRFHSRESGSR